MIARGNSNWLKQTG